MYGRNQPRLSEKLPTNKVYMTQIPGRSRGEFVVHLGMGPVKLAFKGFDFGRVYEMVNNEWSLLYDIPKGTSQEDLPWVKRAVKKPKKEDTLQEVFWRKGQK